MNARGSLFSARVRLVMFTAFPVGLLVGWATDGSVFAFAVSGGAFLLILFLVALSNKPQTSPVETGTDYGRHLTTCALNATGHRGPCTCGGKRVR